MSYATRRASLPGRRGTGDARAGQEPGKSWARAGQELGKSGARAGGAAGEREEREPPRVVGALSGIPEGERLYFLQGPCGMAVLAVEKLEPEVLPTMPDPVASAKAAGLRYVTDTQPGIRRRRSGKGWTYLDPA